MKEFDAGDKLYLTYKGHYLLALTATEKSSWFPNERNKDDSRLIYYNNLIDNRADSICKRFGYEAGFIDSNRENAIRAKSIPLNFNSSDPYTRDMSKMEEYGPFSAFIFEDGKEELIEDPTEDKGKLFSRPYYFKKITCVKDKKKKCDNKDNKKDSDKECEEKESKAK